MDSPLKSLFTKKQHYLSGRCQQRCMALIINILYLTQRRSKCSQREPLSTYAGYNPVYAQDSVRQGKRRAGCGTFSSSLLARLPKYATIMTVRLYALKRALQFLLQRAGKYLILTDSLSSITPLQNVNHHSHYVIFKIAQLLQDFKTKFIVEWVPRHTGLVRNENTDAAAAIAVSLQHTVQVKLSNTEIRKSLKSDLTHCGSSNRLSYPRNNATSDKAGVGPNSSASLPQHQQIIVKTSLHKQIKPKIFI